MFIVVDVYPYYSILDALVEIIPESDSRVNISKEVWRVFFIVANLVVANIIVINSESIEYDRDGVVIGIFE